MTDKQDDVVPTTAVPAGISFSSFATNFDLYEVRLVVGNKRLMMGSDADAPISQVVVDWLLTLQMSPQLTKQLSIALASTVLKYEELFGTIPNIADIHFAQTPGYSLKLN